MKEIREALNILVEAGTPKKYITVMQCNTDYPTPFADANLLAMNTIKNDLKVHVGYSDHTLGIEAPIASAALGAEMIEKHFTLSRNIKTPDSFFSIEPHELKELVKHVRVAERAIGCVYYGLTEDEKKNRIFRRSLFAISDIKKGEFFSEKNIRSIRPANGISPKYLKMILGKKAKQDIKKGTPLRWDLIL